MAPRARSEATDETSSLRADYLASLERYDAAVQQLRTELDDADEALAVLRSHTESGRPMAEALSRIEPDERRGGLSEASIELERARHASQRLLYSILVAEGMTMSDVAAMFGISRGLVSRLVNEQSA